MRTSFAWMNLVRSLILKPPRDEPPNGFAHMSIGHIQSIHHSKIGKSNSTFLQALLTSILMRP
jgi:hypothetical protein